MDKPKTLYLVMDRSLPPRSEADDYARERADWKAGRTAHFTGFMTRDHRALDEAIARGEVKRIEGGEQS